MLKKSALLLFISFAFAIPAVAQGGWDVWTIYLRDGTTTTAAPLWSLDAKSLKGGFMDGGKPDNVGTVRSRVSYLSNSLRNSEYAREKGADFVKPTLPEKSSTRDLVVFADGRQESGSVTIKAKKSKAGEDDIYNPVLLLNGKEYPLTSVAHIRLAASKATPAKTTKSKTKLTAH